MHESRTMKNSIMWWQEYEKDWKTYWLILGDFLDNFYRSPSVNLLSEEPEFDIDIEDYAKAFTAAVCDLLCRRFNLLRPSWLYKENYFLDEPWFSVGKKGLLINFLLVESPAEFRKRNLFVSKKVLDRV